MWLIKPSKKLDNTLKLKWILTLYKVLLKNSTFSKVSYVHICNNNYTISLTKASNPFANIVDSKLLSTFKTFVSIGSTTTNSLITVHPSNKQMFLKSTSGSGNFTSIRLLYCIYKNFNKLVYNMLYYNLKILSFGNSIFRQEILAMNWNFFSHYYSLFKLANSSIFFQPNKLNDKFPKIFKFLRINGFHTAIVYDTNYHKKTVYYLQRLSFFSIGIVPANLPKYMLNVSLPILNDSLLMHLFTIRLFTYIKQDVDNKLFLSFYRLWRNY